MTGSCGPEGPYATEDDAWRRLLAFQAPPCLVGRPTEAILRSGVHTLFGLLGLAVFIPCLVAFAATITWVVVKISPTPPAKQAENKS
jgi:hypothetical protein